jgi:hypothetical protein
MTDAYLLENGTDRYLLEDGSGVLLLNAVGPTREFDGSGDNITMAIGNLANLRDGNLTIAAIIKVDSDVDAGIIEFHNSSEGTTLRCGLVRGGDNYPIGLQDNGGGQYVGPPPALEPNVWCLAAITRSSGTLRSHIYNYGTDTWTHTDGASVTAVDDTLDSVRIGGLDFGSEDFNGRMAVAGAQVGTAHSDGNIETLADSLQAWIDLFTGNAAVWAFNQASVATDVEDLTGGGADETAISGTTVAADGPDPFDWTLDTGGATVTPAPIACTTALPQPGVGVGVTKAPVAAAVAAPQVGVGVGVTKVPVAATSALPKPDLSIGVTKVPVAAVAALPRPGVAVGAAPSPVAAVAALPQTAVGVGVAPAVLAAAASLPQPAVAVGITPAPLAVVVALPQATAGEAAGGDATATPDPIAALASLPQAAVGVGVAPAVLAAVASLFQPAVAVGVTPAPLAALVALPDADVAVGAAPAVLAATVALPQATPDTGGTGAIVQPAAIAALATLPQPAVAVGVAPAPIPLAVALATPLVFSSITVQPATIAAVAALLQPGVGVGVTPAAITVLVAVLLPESVGDALPNINPAGPVMVGAVIVQSAALPGATRRPGAMVGGIT